MRRILPTVLSTFVAACGGEGFFSDQGDVAFFDDFDAAGAWTIGENDRIESGRLCLDLVQPACDTGATILLEPTADQAEVIAVEFEVVEGRLEAMSWFSVSVDYAGVSFTAAVAPSTRSMPVGHYLVASDGQTLHDDEDRGTRTPAPFNREPSTLYVGISGCAIDGFHGGDACIESIRLRTR